MPKAYKVTRHKIKFDKNNIHDVFSVKPVNYGTLTTSQAADQIANESLLTPGDVLNVLNRYSHYVKQNLQKGYAIELLGFGKLDIKFIKTTTPDEKKATSALVKGMMPNFVPSFKIVNGKRIYDLIPEHIKLVKYSGAVVDESIDTPEGDNTGGTNTGGTDNTEEQPPILDEENGGGSGSDSGSGNPEDDFVIGE